MVGETVDRYTGVPVVATSFVMTDYPAMPTYGAYIKRRSRRFVSCLLVFM